MKIVLEGIMSVRRVYETTFIVNAALEDNDIEAVISKVTGYIENHGGNIQEIDKWGRRRLAYPINKKYNGFYVHLIFDANSNTVPILERFLVLEDTVLRHLTLVLPDKLRQFRVKRAIDQKAREEEMKAQAEAEGKKAEEKKEKREAEAVGKD